jgi:hypothetical protein
MFKFLQSHGMLHTSTCPTTNIATPITLTHPKSRTTNVGRQAMTETGERGHPGHVVWRASVLVSRCVFLVFILYFQFSNYYHMILIFYTVYANVPPFPRHTSMHPKTTNIATPITSTHPAMTPGTRQTTCPVSRYVFFLVFILYSLLGLYEKSVNGIKN